VNKQSGGDEPKPDQLATIGEVIRNYQAADYPDKQLNARSTQTRKEEERHCGVLLKFWDSVRVKQTSIAVCDEFRNWRLKRIKQGIGLHTVDRELSTLNNAFRFAYRKGLIGGNLCSIVLSINPPKLSHIADNSCPATKTNCMRSPVCCSALEAARCWGFNYFSRRIQGSARVKY
jgi:hypothetical protein